MEDLMLNDRRYIRIYPRRGGVNDPLMNALSPPSLCDKVIGSRRELEAKRVEMDERMQAEGRNQYTRALLGETPRIARLEYITEDGILIFGVTEGDDLSEPDPPAEVSAPVESVVEVVEVVAIKEAA
jgi:hypothetical protein